MTDAKTMTPEKLYQTLKPIQEAKGYFFNKDMETTMPLMESLLTNKARFGYMACPCRLASGEFEQDRDIVCPCVYREPDVAEYGACFCGLYVSQAWNDESIAHEVVPERRPPDKIVF